jgi:hypothetical protein
VRLFWHEGEPLYFYLGRRDLVVDEEPPPRKEIGQSRRPPLVKDILNFPLPRLSIFNGYRSPSFGEYASDGFLAPWLKWDAVKKVTAIFVGPAFFNDL